MFEVQWKCKLCSAPMRGGDAWTCSSCSNQYAMEDGLVWAIEKRRSPRISLLALIFEGFVLKRRIRGVFLDENHVLSYEQLRARVIQSLPKGENKKVLLDVGARTGSLGRCLAPTWKHVYCVDSTPEMLVQGRRFSNRGRLNNMTFVVSPSESLPFADASFDGATSGGALHWASNVSVTLSEIARTLRPGAQLVGYTATNGGRSVTVKRMTARGARSLFSPEVWREKFLGAGFEDVRIESIDELVIFQGTRKAATV